LLKKKKLAVIGAGNIGTALVGGIIRAKLMSPENIIATRRTRSALDELNRRFGIKITTDNRKAVKFADVIILSVKPQGAPPVLREISLALDESKLIISIMAGITTEIIEKLTGRKLPIIRAMPNTPVLVDAGATAIASGPHATEEHIKIAKTIFNSVGTVEIVPEELMDAITGLSGSGPAYVYMIIEALTDGGVKMGIPREVALKLASQTVFGSAKLVLETRKHPAILKDEVTTPGGTAISAIHELEAHGLRNMLINAVVTATKRSGELSKILNDKIENLK
jgi:pyrroline-5-carboxylate reductase